MPYNLFMRDRIKSFLKNYGTGLIAVFVTWGAFFTALWPKILFRTAQGVSVSGAQSVWGDWAAHLAYANVFALRNITDWFTTHPLYAGFPFGYPFAADAISGLLMRVGMSRIESMILPSIITTFFLLAAIFIFYANELKTPWRAFAATTLFLAGGGLGFVIFFSDLAKNFSMETLLFPPREYTRMLEKGVEWLNILPGEFLPQRPFLLGLPVALFVLIKLILWARRGFQNVSYAKIILLGFASGSLAIIHVHSLIALTVIAGILMLFSIGSWRQWTIFAFSAALVVLLIYIPLYSGMVGGGFFSWRPGWLALNGDVPMNFFRFWFLNWGVFLPFSLLAFWRMRAYRNPLAVSGLAIFALANLFQFQPFIWDNSKLFTWSYLLLAAPATGYLAQIWRRGITLKILTVFIFAVMTASGFLDLWRLTRTDYTAAQIWSVEEETIAEKFREISKPTDITLTSDKHNHWVPMLSGRQIILGYRGWAWTYGINYHPIENDVRVMFAGGPESERLLKEYKVRFAVIGPDEINNYQANEEFFRSRFEKILESKEYRVYRVEL